MTNRALIAASLSVCLLAGCKTISSGPCGKEPASESTGHVVGKTAGGQPIIQYVLINAKGTKATILNLGGVVTHLEVPDAKGKLGDVVLGFDDATSYENTGPYFGAILGRYANRVAGGKFTLDGKTYTLPVNNGPNSLHGGLVGFDKKIWKADASATPQGSSLKLTLVSPDGDQGYPGTVTITAVYTLTDDNALKIDYTATTDKPTVLNLTNHSYFNLTADPAHHTVEGHVVTIDADTYTPADAVQIPTGELKPVAGTPFDFKTPHTVGERLVQTGGDPYGYDHNFVLNGGETKAPRKVVTVSEPTTGRTMEVWTTQPGVQFYTANFLDGKTPGKAGIPYKPYSALCFETQHFPDSPNHPTFPTTVLRPGETFHSTTIYRFTAK